MSYCSTQTVFSTSRAKVASAAKNSEVRPRDTEAAAASGISNRMPRPERMPPLACSSRVITITSVTACTVRCAVNTVRTRFSAQAKPSESTK